MIKPEFFLMGLSGFLLSAKQTNEQSRCHY